MISPVLPLGTPSTPEIDAAFELLYCCKLKAKYKRSEKYMQEMMLMHDAFVSGWIQAKAEAYAEAKAEILAKTKTTEKALPEAALPDWMR